MKPVWVEGEGVIAPDGRFIPEANVRAAIEALSRAVAWIKALPQETQDELQRWADAQR